jgi:hypothetical protein
LIRILALVDVVFSPMPSPIDANQCCSEVFRRRCAYSRGEGVPWTIGGRQEIRREGMEVLARLHESELVALPKASGRHRHVQLTVRGDDLSRSLMGYWRVGDCWHLLRAISEAAHDRRGRGPRGSGIWLLERQLCEAIGGTAGELRAMLLPLLAWWLIEEGVDTDRQFYYTATPRGLVAASNPAPVPQDDVERDERAVSIYWSAYDGFASERGNWRPAGVNEVFIPFPAMQ